MMHEEAPNASLGGMRYNYSQNSLAAAENLSALMRQSATPTADSLARGPQGRAVQAFSGNLQSAMYGMPGGDGLNGNMAALDNPGSLPMRAPDSFDFNQGISQGPITSMFMGGNNDYMRGSGSGMGGFGDASMAQGLHATQNDGGANRSSLSLLHYAACPNPMGGNGSSAMHQSGSAFVGTNVEEGGGQKRRFVWTTDLHSRFEAAVNALGLETAKPKTILKLMNVDGLTKANIKSHLQKYRCSMQKKAAAAAMKEGEGSMGHAGGTASSVNGSNASSIDTAQLDGDEECDSFELPNNVGAEDFVSQGEQSLHKNLEHQEMGLKVQEDMLRDLKQQLEKQKRYQHDMETLMSNTNLTASACTSAKLSTLLEKRRKLRDDLQATLRMQHELLSQLNTKVLPAVERLRTDGFSSGTTSDGGSSAGGRGAAKAAKGTAAGAAKSDAAKASAAAGGGEAGAVSELAAGAQQPTETDESADGGEEEEDDDDETDGDGGASPQKRRRLAEVKAEA